MTGQFAALSEVRAVPGQKESTASFRPGWFFISGYSAPLLY